MFGIVPRPVWRLAIPPDENNAIRLASRSLLVRAGRRVVLIDGGMWNHFPEKLARIYGIVQADIAETLNAQQGLEAAEVTDVIATHLHFDHVGGLFRAAGETLRPVFPNAALHVQKRQLDWARSPSTRDRGSYVPQLVEAIGTLARLVLHDGPWSLDTGTGGADGVERDDCGAQGTAGETAAAGTADRGSPPPGPGPRIDVLAADGHTPGMQLVVVRGTTAPGCSCGLGSLSAATPGEVTVVHAADLVPTAAHVPLPYIMAFDNEPLLTLREKERLYAAHPEALYYFEHDPENPFRRLARNARGNWEAV
jgi:glyoxylase-like metal-dependent hydrolase (beta-lactamase superfamily II)